MILKQPTFSHDILHFSTNHLKTPENYTEKEFVKLWSKAKVEDTISKPVVQSSI
jgi:hypothetical protein